MYQLHSRLAADTLPVATLALCEVRLMNDARFPWLILVPQQDGLTELHQLSAAQQQQLLAESSQVSRLLLTLTSSHKINVAALGNLVPQLHWHVVGRNRADSCWPGPVWGCGDTSPYPAQEAQRLIEQLQAALQSPSVPDIREGA